MNRLPRVVAVLLLAVPLAVMAQAWPSKQIRIIVPFTAGGFNDTLGRILAQDLAKTLGQAVIVENRPGGGSVIGTELAAKSAPDGNTLFIAALPFSVIQSLYKIPLDVTRDFAPITLAGISDNMLVANPAFPVSSVQDLIKLAKSKPGSINYGSSGAGTSVHLSMELFKTMTGTSMTHIAYKGSAPVVTDLLGGTVQMVIADQANLMPHVKSGKLRAIAVASPKRSPNYPELPTIGDTLPGFQAVAWNGLVGPAGMSPDVVAKLNAAVVKVMAQPDVVAKLNGGGLDVVGDAPDEFGRFIRSEIAKWSAIAKQVGAKAD